MIIAFMGNDGSGKTTVIKLLEDKLAKSGRKIVYVSGFQHCFLDQFKLGIQRFASGDISKLQKEYGNSQRKVKRLSFYLWPYLVFIDCLCLYIKYWFQFRKIVIFDRYFYDYVISFQNLGVYSRLEEFFFLLLPKPKNSFVFDVSAEVAYERKKDSHNSDLDYYEKQRLRYLWLAKVKKMPLINTEHSSPGEVAQGLFKRLVCIH